MTCRVGEHQCKPAAGIGAAQLTASQPGAKLSYRRELRVAQLFKFADALQASVAARQLWQRRTIGEGFADAGAQVPFKPADLRS